jgi:hypothetical protein
LLVQDPLFAKHRLSREQYKEMGSSASARHFREWC